MDSALEQHVKEQLGSNPQEHEKGKNAGNRPKQGPSQSLKPEDVIVDLFFGLGELKQEGGSLQEILASVKNRLEKLESERGIEKALRECEKLTQIAKKMQLFARLLFNRIEGLSEGKKEEYSVIISNFYEKSIQIEESAQRIHTGLKKKKQENEVSGAHFSESHQEPGVARKRAPLKDPLSSEEEDQAVLFMMGHVNDVNKRSLNNKGDRELIRVGKRWMDRYFDEIVKKLNGSVVLTAGKTQIVDQIIYSPEIFNILKGERAEEAKRVISEIRQSEGIKGSPQEKLKKLATIVSAMPLRDESQSGETRLFQSSQFHLKQVAENPNQGMNCNVRALLLHELIKQYIPEAKTYAFNEFKSRSDNTGWVGHVQVGVRIGDMWYQIDPTTPLNDSGELVLISEEARKKFTHQRKSARQIIDANILINAAQHKGIEKDIKKQLYTLANAHAPTAQAYVGLALLSESKEDITEYLRKAEMFDPDAKKIYISMKNSSINKLPTIEMTPAPQVGPPVLAINVDDPVQNFTPQQKQKIQHYQRYLDQMLNSGLPEPLEDPDVLGGLDGLLKDPELSIPEFAQERARVTNAIIKYKQRERENRGGEYNPYINLSKTSQEILRSKDRKKINEWIDSSIMALFGSGKVPIGRVNSGVMALFEPFQKSMEAAQVLLMSQIEEAMRNKDLELAEMLEAMWGRTVDMSTSITAGLSALNTIRNTPTPLDKYLEEVAKAVKSFNMSKQAKLRGYKHVAALEKMIEQGVELYRLRKGGVNRFLATEDYNIDEIMAEIRQRLFDDLESNGENALMHADVTEHTQVAVELHESAKNALKEKIKVSDTSRTWDETLLQQEVDALLQKNKANTLTDSQKTLYRDLIKAYEGTLKRIEDHKKQAIHAQLKMAYVLFAATRESERVNAGDARGSSFTVRGFAMEGYSRANALRALDNPERSSSARMLYWEMIELAKEHVKKNKLVGPHVKPRVLPVFRMDEEAKREKQGKNKFKGYRGPEQKNNWLHSGLYEGYTEKELLDMGFAIYFFERPLRNDTFESSKWRRPLWEQALRPRLRDIIEKCAAKNIFARDGAGEEIGQGLTPAEKAEKYLKEEFFLFGRLRDAYENGGEESRAKMRPVLEKIAQYYTTDLMKWMMEQDPSDDIFVESMLHSSADFLGEISNIDIFSTQNTVTNDVVSLGYQKGTRDVLVHYMVEPQTRKDTYESEINEVRARAGGVVDAARQAGYAAGDLIALQPGSPAWNRLKGLTIKVGDNQFEAMTDEDIKYLQKAARTLCAEYRFKTYLKDYEAATISTRIHFLQKIMPPKQIDFGTLTPQRPEYNILERELGKRNGDVGKVVNFINHIQQVGGVRAGNAVQHGNMPLVETLLHGPRYQGYYYRVYNIMDNLDHLYNESKPNMEEFFAYEELYRALSNPQATADDIVNARKHTLAALGVKLVWQGDDISYRFPLLLSLLAPNGNDYAKVQDDLRMYTQAAEADTKRREAPFADNRKEFVKAVLQAGEVIGKWRGNAEASRYVLSVLGDGLSLVQSKNALARNLHLEQLFPNLANILHGKTMKVKNMTQDDLQKLLVESGVYGMLEPEDREKLLAELSLLPQDFVRRGIIYAIVLSFIIATFATAKESVGGIGKVVGGK